MSAKMIEVGRLHTVDELEPDDIGVRTYPMAMLIEFDTAEELRAAIESRSVSFQAWGEESPA